MLISHALFRGVYKLSNKISNIAFNMVLCGTGSLKPRQVNMVLLESFGAGFVLFSDAPTSSPFYTDTALYDSRGEKWGTSNL